LRVLLNLLSKSLIPTTEKRATQNDRPECQLEENRGALTKFRHCSRAVSEPAHRNFPSWLLSSVSSVAGAPSPRVLSVSPGPFFSLHKLKTLHYVHNILFLFHFFRNFEISSKT
jgi:hypothetical protein